MNKKYTAEEANKLEKKWTVILTTAVLFFIAVCLPALVIGGILYFVFGG